MHSAKDLADRLNAYDRETVELERAAHEAADRARVERDERMDRQGFSLEDRAGVSEIIPEMPERNSWADVIADWPTLDREASEAALHSGTIVLAGGSRVAWSPGARGDRWAVGA